MVSKLTIPNEPPHKADKMACTPSDDSDEPGHPPSLIRIFTVRMKKVPIERLEKTLIRLGGVQADLSLRWSHNHIVGFVRVRQKLFCLIICLIFKPKKSIR